MILSSPSFSVSPSIVSATLAVSGSDNAQVVVDASLATALGTAAKKASTTVGNSGGSTKPSQILRLEPFSGFGGRARQHEDAIDAVVQRGRVFRRGRHMRFHHFKHEQAVGRNELGVVELALEARITFLD